MKVPEGQLPLVPQIPKSAPRNRDTVYFDLETQYSFDEVGGRHKMDLLRVAVAVTYSAEAGQFRSYTEEQVQGLLAELRQAELVVGFNIKAFDYKVLQPYTEFSLSKVRTLDIMDHVVRELGFRLSLNALASATLGEGKTADGLQSIRWFREGKLEQVITYCQKDVEIVRKLYEFGAKEGYLLYSDRFGKKKRLSVSWRRKKTL